MLDEGREQGSGSGTVRLPRTPNFPVSEELRAPAPGPTVLSESEPLGAAVLRPGTECTFREPASRRCTMGIPDTAAFTPHSLLLLQAGNDVLKTPYLGRHSAPAIPAAPEAEAELDQRLEASLGSSPVLSLGKYRIERAGDAAL